MTKICIDQTTDLREPVLKVFNLLKQVSSEYQLLRENYEYSIRQIKKNQMLINSYKSRIKRLSEELKQSKLKNRHYNLEFDQHNPITIPNKNFKSPKKECSIFI